MLKNKENYFIFFNLIIVTNLIDVFHGGSELNIIILFETLFCATILIRILSKFFFEKYKENIKNFLEKYDNLYKMIEKNNNLLKNINIIYINLLDYCFNYLTNSKKFLLNYYKNFLNLWKVMVYFFFKNFLKKNISNFKNFKIWVQFLL